MACICLAYGTCSRLLAVCFWLQELDPEHVPAGRRCTHCTNLRPVAYFNHVKAKCVTCQGIAAPVPTLPPASSVALPGAGHGEAHAVAEAGASHRLGAYQSLLLERQICFWK